LKKNIFEKNQKCLLTYLNKLCFSEVFIKIFRAVELAPPFPLPLTGLCRG
jgi:hypothetical protein